MTQFTPQQLREVLNYDTNKEKCFDLVERNQIHRAICSLMNGHDYKMPDALDLQIKEVRNKIKTTSYKSVEIFYYIDQETMHIKSKTL